MTQSRSIGVEQRYRHSCWGFHVFLAISDQLHFSTCLTIAVTQTVPHQYFALAMLATRRNKALNRNTSLSLVRADFAGLLALTPPLWALAIANGVDLISVYWFPAVGSLFGLRIVLERDKLTKP